MQGGLEDGFFWSRASEYVEILGLEYVMLNILYSLLLDASQACLQLLMQFELHHGSL
jgi:hypothetical protein